MKNNLLKFLVGTMACFGVAMAVTAVLQVAHGQDATNSLLQDCDQKGFVIDSQSIYGDFSMDLEDVMAKYHENINKKFNAAIKKMIVSKEGDDNGKAPTDDQINQLAASMNTPGLTDDDKHEQAIEALCSDDSNYSTFCLGNRLLTNKAYGYLQYRYALSCRKTDLDLGIQSAKPNMQAQVVADQSQKESALTNEISQAKQALDQTLSAYDQLKTAWLMHKRYMAIYESLKTYRDKMADIRQQVENFPGKFIDVSTTKCT